jgi:hypothetical protein
MHTQITLDKDLGSVADDRADYMLVDRIPFVQAAMIYGYPLMVFHFIAATPDPLPPAFRTAPYVSPVTDSMTGGRPSWLNAVIPQPSRLRCARQQREPAPRDHRLPRPVGYGHVECC